MTVAIFPDIIQRPPMRFTLSLLWFLALTSSLAPADPTWWEARGVKSTAPAANMAPATIGQAKHMAAMALAELEGHLPAPSFQALETDLDAIVDLKLPVPLPPGFHEGQRAVLLTGQLKAIAKPFYDHLRIYDSAWLDNAMTVGNLVVMEPGSDPPTPSPYPWSEATTDDANRAPATLGQLKAVFSLPLETLTPPTITDTDGDGMSDAWEIAHGFDPNDPADADFDSDNDGINNLQEYQLGLSPNSADSVGPRNFGFDEEIMDSPDLSFRPENPSDLYPADSVLHWRAAIGQHIEIWDEGDGNPYAELQSHWDAKGIEQEFDMLPGTRLTFILRYKGRYDGYNDSNPFFLKVEGAHEVLVNGQPAQTQGSVKQASFMADDEWEKYSGWHHASITIDTDPQATTLVPITLTLMPDSTDEAITYGGFVDLIPVDLDVNGDGDISDPCDGLATYMPGYELSTAKLHTGTSFENSQYAGPQSMNIIIDNLPSSMADEAHIRIVAGSNWFGYCGNGSIANESPILAYWDFSLDGQETVSSTQEATVTSTGNKMVIPIYCHDYGGWCEVEITLKKSGATIGSPIKLTLPHDGNGDRLADRWQDAEITAWNTQFGTSRLLEDAERDKMKPGSGYDLSDYADDEMKKSDGASGSMPEMADEGDGLKVIEEYRGCIFDGGPGTTPGGHKRLKTARKELLVECKEMIGTPFAQGYSLAGTMGAVSTFFGNDGPAAGKSGYFVGTMLDTYWVRVALNDSGTYVTYSDGTSRLAYKHTGNYTDQRSGNTMTGTLCIGWDYKLRFEDRDQCEAIYGRSSAGLGILVHENNRNVLCEDFVKFVIRGKKGEVMGTGAVRAPTDGSALEVDQRQEPDRYIYQGAAIWASSIAEQQQAPGSTPFADELAFAVAHELGHMIVIATADGEHFYSGTNNLMNYPVGLSNALFLKDEIEHINLPQRASVKP